MWPPLGTLVYRRRIITNDRIRLCNIYDSIVPKVFLDLGKVPSRFNGHLLFGRGRFRLKHLASEGPPAVLMVSDAERRTPPILKGLLNSTLLPFLLRRYADFCFVFYFSSFYLKTYFIFHRFSERSIPPDFR